MELKRHMHSAWTLAQQNIQRAQIVQKSQYDKTAMQTTFQKGQYVLIFSPAVPVGLSAKFLHRWHGPYEILETQGVNLLVRLFNDTKAQPLLVHVNRCKLSPTPIIESSDVVKRQKLSEISEGESRNVNSDVMPSGENACTQRYNLRPRK